MHLFVCLTDPIGQPYETLLVSVSSVAGKPWIDRTCILPAGCHEFIREESFVSYRHCRVEEAAVIEAGVKAGRMAHRAPIDGDLCQAMSEGLFLSPHTAAKYRNFYRGWQSSINDGDTEAA
ncbi:MAG: hypothetical protein AB7G13_22445 [Lautropia sp.]